MKYNILGALLNSYFQSVPLQIQITFAYVIGIRIPIRRLSVSRPFHSSQPDSIIQEFLDIIDEFLSRVGALHLTRYSTNWGLNRARIFVTERGIARRGEVDCQGG